MHLRKVELQAERFPVTDRYPFNQPVLRETSLLEFHSPITFFVGENGTGKSTLLEAITRTCGIYIWRSTERTRYERNPHEKQLHRYLNVEWANGHVPGAFFGSDSFRHFRQSLDEWAAADPGMLAHFGGESLVTKSHGQSVLSYFAARYRLRGLYLMDEPESALSPRSQLGLLKLLGDMARAGHAQFIIASHSPILLACPEAELLSFDTVPISSVRYEDTDYYQLYKAFLNRPEQFTSGTSAQ